jgi:hypothetical protein
MHEMLRRTVLGSAIAGAALLQGRAFAQSGHSGLRPIQSISRRLPVEPRRLVSPRPSC